MTQNFLNGIGCNWKMTSMGYINKMNSDYPDDTHGEKTQEVDIWKSAPGLEPFFGDFPGGPEIAKILTKNWGSGKEPKNF